MTKRGNFTIIEILTVIVIISILTALVLGIAGYATERSHRAKTLSKLTALEQGLENCLQDRGYYPSTESGSTGVSPSGAVQLGDYADFSQPKLSSVKSSWDLQSGQFTNRQTGGTYIEGYKGGEYLDSWGRPFLYRCENPAPSGQHNKSKFDLWSAGPDGTSGTEDDITNWKAN